MEKVFRGIKPETATETNPKGKQDLKELDRIERESLDRLYSMQHSDGGWGWWKDDSSDHFMTAYVLWGLTLAQNAGLPIKSEVAANAAKYLNAELVEEENNYDMQAWLLQALATYHASAPHARNGHPVTDFQMKAFDNLWKNREKLNAYTRALLALSAHYFGDTEHAQILVRNLENGVKIDRAPDTSIIQRGPQASD